MAWTIAQLLTSGNASRYNIDNGIAAEKFYCDKTTLEDLYKYHKIEYEIIEDIILMKEEIIK